MTPSALTQYRRLSLAILSTLLLLLSGCEKSENTLYNWGLALERSRSNVVEMQLPVDGFDIAILKNEWHPDRPTLMMVHGFAANKESWLRMTRFLTDSYNLLLLDLPAHGASSQLPDRLYTIDNQARTVEALLAQLQPPAPILIGNSMGGAIVAVVASRQPLQGLVLFNPAGVSEVPSEFFKQLENGQNPLIPASAEEFDAVIDFVMEQPPVIPWPVRDVLARDAVARLPMRQKVFNDLLQSGEAEEFLKTLRQVDEPALIIWGDSDRVLNAGNADVFVREMPLGRKLILEDIGHVPMLEDPELSADAVDAFVRGLASSGALALH